MVPASDNIKTKKYYTTIGGFSVYRANRVDLSKLRDCIIAQPNHSLNVMIIDHVPKDSDGWDAIRCIYQHFKLVSKDSPCPICKNKYECIFKNNAPLSDCIEACKPLLKEHIPFPNLNMLSRDIQLIHFVPRTFIVYRSVRNL